MKEQWMDTQKKKTWTVQKLHPTIMCRDRNIPNNYVSELSG